MNEITFEILKIVVIISAALISAYLIPFIKAKTANTKYGDLLDIVEKSVKAAEQKYKGSGQGSIKYEKVVDYVTSELLKRGIIITDEQLDTLIEAFVYEINRKK